jgi:hypothetical protein
MLGICFHHSPQILLPNLSEPEAGTLAVDESVGQDHKDEKRVLEHNPSLYENAKGNNRDIVLPMPRQHGVEKVVVVWDHEENEPEHCQSRHNERETCFEKLVTLAIVGVFRIQLPVILCG